MGGSAAEASTAPDAQPVKGLRVSDAERDEVVAKLKDEFAAGRLSKDTFLYRVNEVLKARHQEDLPPLVADLPAAEAPAVPQPGTPAAGRVRSLLSRLTAGLPRVGAGERQPLPLQFPRGTGGSFSIGRNVRCDLAIADMTVSRVHARLERTPDGWLLTDLASTNGTRVNGWRVRGQVWVRAGDLVSFGDAEYSLCPADEV